MKKTILVMSVLFFTFGISFVGIQAFNYVMGQYHLEAGKNKLSYFDTVDQNREINIEYDLSIATQALYHFNVAATYGAEPGNDIQDATEKRMMYLDAKQQLKNAPKQPKHILNNNDKAKRKFDKAIDKIRNRKTDK